MPAVMPRVFRNNMWLGIVGVSLIGDRLGFVNGGMRWVGIGFRVVC